MQSYAMRSFLARKMDLKQQLYSSILIDTLVAIHSSNM